MSATYLKKQVFNHTPSGNVAAGDVVVVGGIVAVATEAIAANTEGALETAGLFDLDLAESKTFSAGDPVYVDDSEATDSGTWFGWAVAASASGKVKALLVQTSVEES